MTTSNWARLIIKLDEIQENIEREGEATININDIDAFVVNQVDQFDGIIEMDFIKKYTASGQFTFNEFPGDISAWYVKRFGQLVKVDHNAMSDYIGYIIEYIAVEKIAN